MMHVWNINRWAQNGSVAGCSHIIHIRIFIHLYAQIDGGDEVMRWNWINNNRTNINNWYVSPYHTALQCKEWNVHVLHFISSSHDWLFKDNHTSTSESFDIVRSFFCVCVYHCIIYVHTMACDDWWLKMSGCIWYYSMTNVAYIEWQQLEHSIRFDDVIVMFSFELFCLHIHMNWTFDAYE